MSKITAIVIDDKSDTTRLMAELLELQDVQVVGIGFNGNGAIRLVKEKNPDVVFLDINMPEKDGIVALQEIKQFSPLTRVVVVTGENLDIVQENNVSKKADFVLYKPFDIEKLIQIITSIRIQMTTHARNL